MPKRYIDADELLREISFYADRPTKSAMNTIKGLAMRPDPDVVKVVRCQDCKYHESIKMANGYLPFCRKHRLIDDLMRSDFCSDGERRNKINE